MAIVVVGGSAKGVGDSTLICALIQAFYEIHWTAVKIVSSPLSALADNYSRPAQTDNMPWRLFDCPTVAKRSTPFRPPPRPVRNAWLKLNSGCLSAPPK
jgi:hypothetical protein